MISGAVRLPYLHLVPPTKRPILYSSAPPSPYRTLSSKRRPPKGTLSTTLNLPTRTKAHNLHSLRRARLRFTLSSCASAAHIADDLQGRSRPSPIPTRSHLSSVVLHPSPKLSPPWSVFRERSGFAGPRCIRSICPDFDFVWIPYGSSSFHHHVRVPLPVNR